MREADDDPLGFLDTADTYCTVLFNDETHTFEQVRKQSKYAKCVLHHAGHRFSQGTFFLPNVITVSW
jgi:hypothetical protein